MSNIYIQEPPTSGKVLLVTTVGEIDIELWSKECPKACRNFIQLCLEGYYDDTPFHRVVPEFIVQGGDPTGTGDGGESIYGKTFKDEIHSRLRFVRRGLVAMANAGRDDNGSQFFFTLGPTQELQGKHTLFGKVTGNTVFNMLKLAEVDIGADDRPVDPHKITKTKILHNPFDDIVPRVVKKQNKSEGESKKKKSTAKATKNFKLLSFGEEAEEDEEENTKIVEKIKKKSKAGGSKSSHDLLDDHTLSTLPAVDINTRTTKKKSDKRKQDKDSDGDDDEEDEREAVKERIRKKLRTETSSKHFLVDEGSSGDEAKEKSQKITELQKEAKRLKKELLKKEAKPEETKAKESDDDLPDDNEMVKNYKAERRKYKEQKKALPKKGSARESETLAMLSSFQSKLSSLAQFADYNEEEEAKAEEEGEGEGEEDANDISWMNHKLTFDETNRKVMDANVKELDRYEIFDPRNPINQRRREESKKQMKEGKKKS